MPLTPDPYEESSPKELTNEETPDHGTAIPDVAEGIDSIHREEEETR